MNSEPRMTPAYGRGNVSGSSKNNAPAKADLTDVVVPHRNSSMKASYVPPTWNVRANADDHLQIKSLGLLTSQPKETA